MIQSIAFLTRAVSDLKATRHLYEGLLLPGHAGAGSLGSSGSTSARISMISLIVFVVLLVLSAFLLSVAGEYWPWYSVMAGFAVAPVIVGPNRHRILGAIALALSLVLIFGDIEAGKDFRARHPEIYRQ